LLFVKIQVSDRDSTITDHEKTISDCRSEINKIVEKLDNSPKTNDELEYNLNLLRQESEEKIISANNDLFNSQTLLKERGKQLEELMKTIDVLKSEGHMRDSIDVSQSMSIRQSIESAKLINFATLDQDRLITHL
jgi:septal ring factor EnvC (AmiA/AmiB activator)